MNIVLLSFSISNDHREGIWPAYTVVITLMKGDDDGGVPRNIGPQLVLLSSSKIGSKSGNSCGPM